VTEDEHYDTALRRWNAAHRRRDQITGNLVPLSGADRVEIEQAAEKLRAAANPTPELDERCKLSELPKASCSHCRPGPARPVLVDGTPGTCGGCGEPYPAGSTIERLGGGGYAGPECVNQA
jgi:hypothetical protein